MRARGKIFVLDDDELIVSMLARALKKEGYEVRTATDPREVLDKIRAFSPDAMLLDNKLPGATGLELLPEILGRGLAAQVTMLTSDDSADTAVKAMKLGAADYVTKPFNLDELKIVVRNVLEKVTLTQEVDYLRKVSSELMYKEFIGTSPAVAELKKQAARLAEAGVTTILITGESGTGKEVFARHTHRAIHRESGYGYAPFVGINCAALPEQLIESELFGHEKGSFTDAKTDKKGVFEMAHGGSILLDEIGEMQPLLQTRLLRVLEQRTVRRIGGKQDIPIDATVFATTNSNLAESVDRGMFRSDLLYRLNAFAVHIPPLRDRREDITALARYFLDHFSVRYKRRTIQGFSPEAEKLLRSHSWPGNVREVRNVIERIVVLESGDTVLPEHLPREILDGTKASATTAGPATGISLPDGGVDLKEVEKHLIMQALEKTAGNRTQAAKLLGVSYDSLRYQIKKFGLE